MSPEMLESHSCGPFAENKKYNPWKSIKFSLLYLKYFFYLIKFIKKGDVYSYGLTLLDVQILKILNIFKNVINN